jgi:hypothetical protein
MPLHTGTQGFTCAITAALTQLPALHTGGTMCYPANQFFKFADRRNDADTRIAGR